MIIFGWIVLLCITVIACVNALMIFFANLALESKQGAETAVFAVIAGLLVWASLANFPFIVTAAS